MGHATDLGKDSTTESFKRCMISITSPRQGSTRFIMIRRNRPGRFNLFDLRQWLESETDDDEWIALHSTGFHTSISTAEWDMPLGLREAGVKRLGVALHLSEKDPVEINLMHRNGVRIKASSHERDFPPAYIAGGHFFHHPLEPRLWISRPAWKDPLPWIEVEFPDARKVNRLRLIWAGAAGWSQEYNPIFISILTSNEWGGSLYEASQIRNPNGPVFDWDIPNPVRIRRLRIQFDGPSGDSLDSRARLYALEAWEDTENW